MTRRGGERNNSIPQWGKSQPFSPVFTARKGILKETDLVEPVPLPLHRVPEDLHALVIHAGGGRAVVDIYPDRIVIVLADHGPGIPDIELAMKDGYSTAPDAIRDLGFGAGMGLPNMKKYTDSMNIDSTVGVGTTVTMIVNFGQ